MEKKVSKAVQLATEFRNAQIAEINILTSLCKGTIANEVKFIGLQEGAQVVVDVSGGMDVCLTSICGVTRDIYGNILFGDDNDHYYTIDEIWCGLESIIEQLEKLC